MKEKIFLFIADMLRFVFFERSTFHISFSFEYLLEMLYYEFRFSWE